MAELDCFGCGTTKDESEMTAIPGKGDRSPRHFCSAPCYESWSGKSAGDRFEDNRTEVPR